MGMRPARRAAIFSWILSTQTTSFPRSAKTAPVTSPTYPVPITQMFMGAAWPPGNGNDVPFLPRLVGRTGPIPETRQDARRLPHAGRRPAAAGEAHSLYVPSGTAGAGGADGPL